MNRLLNLIAFAIFATSLSLRAVDPIIPQIAGGLRVMPETVALLSTAFALPYAIVQPLLGILADMFRKTRMITVCLLIAVIAALVGAFATSFEVLLASRMVAGVVAGGIFPIALAIAGDRVPLAQRQVAIGRLLFASMAGNLLGASGAGLIGDLVGWRGVFFATAGIGTIALVATTIGFRGMEEQPGRFDLSTVGPNYRAIFGNPLAKVCFSAVFLEAAFLFGIFPYMATMLHAAGETRAFIAGVVIAGFGIGGIFYTLAISRLLPRAGERRLMIGGGIAMGLGLAIIALRAPWPVEFANFIMLGFGMYMLHGVIQIYASELAPAARGSAMALHSCFFFLGQAVGPVVYGAGFATVGVQPVLLLGAVVMVGLGVICARYLRRQTVSAS